MDQFAVTGSRPFLSRNKCFAVFYVEWREDEGKNLRGVKKNGSTTMPLKRVDRPNYLKRTRLFVSNQERTAASSKDAYTFTYDLETEIQDVVSIELTGWTIHKKFAPTFIGRYSQTTLPYASTTNPRSAVPGNSMVDVEITDETGVITIVFPVDMELVIPPTGIPVSYGGRTLTLAELSAATATAFSLAFLNFGHAVLNPTNYNVVVGGDVLGRFIFYLTLKANPALKPTIRLLFGTGPNRSDAMNRVLGFPLEDTTPDPTTLGVQSPCSLEPMPLRYVDVILPQFPELNPVGRVFLAPTSDADFKQPDDKPEAVRLLSEPVRRMAELRVELRLPGDQAPNPEVEDEGVDLEFEVLSLAAEGCIPNWMNQKLLY